MESRNPDELLTPEQVATIALTTTGTLKFWRHKARGPAYIKVGRSVRYRRRDLDAWLLENRHG